MDESLDTVDQWPVRHLSHPPDHQPRLQGLDGHHLPAVAVVFPEVRRAIVHDAEWVKWRASVAVRRACCLFEVPLANGFDVVEVDFDVLVPVLAVVLVCCT